MTERKIVHVDMDQFFAAVEQRDAPDLRGRPVAVGHDVQRGVVSTASYEARKFGVHSAQSIQVAKRLCPQLIIVNPHFPKYKEVSQQIRSITTDHILRAKDDILPLAKQLMKEVNYNREQPIRLLSLGVSGHREDLPEEAARWAQLELEFKEWED